MFCDKHNQDWPDRDMCPSCLSATRPEFPESGKKRLTIYPDAPSRPPAVSLVRRAMSRGTDTPLVRSGYAPDTSKVKLLVFQCPDSTAWYADKVGQHIPYCGTWPEGYKSREDAGYLNIVKFEDAQIVHLP